MNDATSAAHGSASVSPSANDHERSTRSTNGNTTRFGVHGLRRNDGPREGEHERRPAKSGEGKADAGTPPSHESDADDGGGIQDQRTDEKPERAAAERPIHRSEHVEHRGAEVMPAEPVEHTQLDRVVSDVTDVELGERVVLE